MSAPFRSIPLPPAAITGIGAITPLGADPEALAEGLRAGARGLEIRFDPRGHLPAHAARRMDRLSRLAAVAALRAAGGAGLDGLAPERIGVAYGTTYGDLSGLLGFLDRLDARGPHLANPADFPNLVTGATAGYLCQIGGWRGPQFAACRPGRAGQEAIVWALERLADGDADAVVAVAGDGRGEARAALAPEGRPAGEAVGAVVLRPLDAARGRGMEVWATVTAVETAPEDLPSPIDPELEGPWGDAPADGIVRLVAAVLRLRGAWGRGEAPRAVSVRSTEPGPPFLIVRAV